jgi:hypothetical protein
MTIGPSLQPHPLTGAAPQAPKPEFRVRHQQTTFDVEATPLELRIDNQPTRDALNLRTPTGLRDQGLSQWRSAGAEAVTQIVANGDRLGDIASGESHVVANLAREEYTSSSIPGLALATLPAPELMFTPKTVRMLWRTTEEP